MAKDINSKIGNKIRYYRNSRNLTQQALADKVGISWEMISRYERGSSSVFNNIDKICDALGINVYDLFSDKLDPSRQRFSRIPLYDSTQLLGKIDPTRTMKSYHAPDWLLLSEDDPFAVILDTSIHINTEKIRGRGVIFLLSEPKPKQQSVILYAKGTELVIDKLIDYQKIRSSVRYIGTVVGQEVRI